MLNVLAGIFAALAAGAGYAGVFFNWGHVVNAYGYEFRWAFFVIAAVLLAAAIGVWRRQPWSRALAEGVCVFGALLVVVGAALLVVTLPMTLVVAIGWGEQRGAGGGLVAWIAAAVVGAVPMLLLIRRAWRYLDSEAAEVAFGGKPGAIGSTGASPIFIGLALGGLAWAGLLGHDRWHFDSRNVPSALRTTSMERIADSGNAIEAANFIRSWMFSDDDERVAFETSEGLVILDAQSGKVTRKNGSDYLHYPETWRWVSPDARRFISSGGELVTLAGDSSRKVKSLPPHFHSLGFAGADRVLVVYDARGVIKLRLVDLGTDRPIYEKELSAEIALPNLDRGGWSMERGEWSPDRSKLVWVDEARRLHVLDVASGDISSHDCPCRAKATVVFFREGDRIYLSPENAGVYHKGSSPTRGPLFDLTTSSFTPSALDWGTILRASSRESRIVQAFPFPAPVIRQFRLPNLERPAWTLPVSQSPTAMDPDGKVLVWATDSAPGELRVIAVAPADAPKETDATSKPATLAPAALAHSLGLQFSPKGSFLLLVSSPDVEIIRSETLRKPERSSLALDLRTGKPPATKRPPSK